MTYDVTVGEEQTSPETSQVSEEETTNYEQESEDLSSSEDVNTQSEEENEELVDQAMNQVQSDKGKNRVQELANQVQSLREQLKEATQQQLYSEPTQAQTPEEYYAIERQKDRMRMDMLEQELAWNEATKVAPELDKTSKDYSPEFENLVYSNYLTRRQRGEYVTPSEIAKETKSYLNKLVSKAGLKNATVREVKKVVSPIGGNRKPSDKEYSDYQSKRDIYRQTQSIDDLANLLDKMA